AVESSILVTVDTTSTDSRLSVRAPAKRERGSDAGSSTVLLQKKSKRLEQVEQVEGEEELEEDEVDLDYEPKVKLALKRRAQRAEERVAAAEEERKAAKERTKLIEKQLADIQAMMTVLQQQMQMQ